MRIFALLIIFIALMQSTAHAGTATGTIGVTLLQPFEVDGPKLFDTHYNHSGRLSAKAIFHTQPGITLSVVSDDKVLLSSSSSDKKLIVTNLHAMAMLHSNNLGEASMDLAGQLIIDRQTVPGRYSGIVNITADYQ